MRVPEFPKVPLWCVVVKGFEEAPLMVRNMASLVSASCFAAVYLGQCAKLNILAHREPREAKRIHGIPDFRYYTLTNGIKFILTRAGRGIWHHRWGIPPQRLNWPCLAF